MKISLYILLFFVLTDIGYAQEHTRNTDLSKALQVGDQFIPPKHVSLMRGDIKSINWKSIANKVIILDFFDTYCPTCIQAMPHLQELQNLYGDKIQVINVAWQDKATLEKFFATNEFLKEKQVNLPVIYADQELRSLFPYQAAPHVVMLYQGKVQAITFNRLVTAENVLSLYQYRQISLPLKNDFGKGVFMEEDADLGESSNNIGVRITAFQDGVPSRGLTFDIDSLKSELKSTIYNRSIYRALLNIWATIQKPRFFVNSDRIVWKVKDSTRYDDLSHQGEAWASKYAICYERLDTKLRPDSVQAKIVLNDLHSLLGVKSYWSTKSTNAIILRSCPKGEYQGDPISKVQNYEGTKVLAGILAFSGRFPPIVDEVKSIEKIRIGNFETIVELNQQLLVYGIQATTGIADVEVFVIEEE